MQRPHTPQPFVLIVIPARHASTRFPGKPLADIAGIPMVVRVLRQARMSRYASRVVVATDDERIAIVVREHGGEAVLTSPECATGTERMAEVAGAIPADVYVNVQGDEPLIDPAVIDAVIEPMLHNGAPDVATASGPLAEEDYVNPNVVKVVVSSTGDALYFSRAAIPYDRDGGRNPASASAKHIGIYAFTAEALRRMIALPERPLERLERLEQLRALEHGMRIHVVPVESASPSVDTPEDAEHVASMIRATGAGLQNGKDSL